MKHVAVLYCMFLVSGCNNSLHTGGRVGLKIKKDLMPVFQLEKVKLNLGLEGVTYRWKKRNTNSSIILTVNVCKSQKIAIQQVDRYFSTSSMPYKKQQDKPLVGDISWHRKEYPSLIFIRDNIKVIMNSTSAKEISFDELIHIAEAIDKTILNARIILKDSDLIRPIVPEITLKPSKLTVGQKAKVILRPKNSKYFYAYQATGGNILKGKNGEIYFYPEQQGKQSVTVFVANEYNVMILVEKSVLVLK